MTTMSISTNFDGDRDRCLGVNSNGCLPELRVIDGVETLIHYDDIPESDITEVKGIRCTTPLRTVIDIAADVERPELENILLRCLVRELFTVAEARQRLQQPDVAHRPGALVFGGLLDELEGPA